MDFTLASYASLLSWLKENNYNFQTVEEFITSPKSGNVIILRHDVDKSPTSSLSFARVEKNLDIKSTYYFRAGPESWNSEIIKEISTKGHEVGYHYESLTTCNGDIDRAYYDFLKNLQRFRKLIEVKTICMHGSPLSSYDNKIIWSKYSYKDLGIIGEPYLDIDYLKVFYLTDTGRRWDGYNVNIRDKIIDNQVNNIYRDFCIKSTFDLINQLYEISKCYPAIMITTHPQRWTDNKFLWVIEFISQSVKNIFKRIIIKMRQPGTF